MTDKERDGRRVALARRLRRRQTRAERLLWRRLRDRRLAGFKFRRQYPVGSYVLDFYCPKKKLAIELDGGGHTYPEKVTTDRRRTRELEQEGIRVIRFWNDGVTDNLEEVLRRILAALGEKDPPSP